MEWLSGDWEAAAEARQGGGGGFPCLLKSLGKKLTAGPVSSPLGLLCLLSPRKEDSGSHWAGEKIRGCCSNLIVYPRGGSAGSGTGSSKDGLAWVRRGPWKGLGVCDCR